MIFPWEIGIEDYVKLYVQRFNACICVQLVENFHGYVMRVRISMLLEMRYRDYINTFTPGNVKQRLVFFKLTARVKLRFFFFFVSSSAVAFSTYLAKLCGR